MNYGAEADLEIILRAGIERGANVIGFGAERDARSVCPIDAAAELQPANSTNAAATAVAGHVRIVASCIPLQGETQDRHGPVPLPTY